MYMYIRGYPLTTVIGFVRAVDAIPIKVAPVGAVHALVERGAAELVVTTRDRLATRFLRLVLSAPAVALAVAHVLVLDARVVALLTR